MKRLHRSKKNRLVKGVFGGIAEYSNADTTLLRLIFLLPVLVLGLPAGIVEIILYTIAGIIVPEEHISEEHISEEHIS